MQFLHLNIEKNRSNIIFNKVLVLGIKDIKLA